MKRNLYFMLFILNMMFSNIIYSQVFLGIGKAKPQSEFTQVVGDGMKYYGDAFINVWKPYLGFGLSWDYSVFPILIRGYNSQIKFISCKPGLAIGYFNKDSFINIYLGAAIGYTVAFTPDYKYKDQFREYTLATDIDVYPGLEYFISLKFMFMKGFGIGLKVLYNIYDTSEDGRLSLFCPPGQGNVEYGGDYANYILKSVSSLTILVGIVYNVF